MKKLLPILLIGVMLFSIGIVAFANPRMEYCTATGGPHEPVVMHPGSTGILYVCLSCGDDIFFEPYE